MWRNFLQGDDDSSHLAAASEGVELASPLNRNPKGNQTGINHVRGFLTLKQVYIIRCCRTALAKPHACSHLKAHSAKQVDHFEACIFQDHFSAH